MAISESRKLILSILGKVSHPELGRARFAQVTVSPIETLESLFCNPSSLCKQRSGLCLISGICNLSPYFISMSLNLPLASETI